ncbi:MAG: hypothetical protein QXJ02_02695 [Candidatus Bathyarchaeia archaeon]
MTLVVWENITVTHWLSNGSDKWEYHSKLLSEPIIGAEYHMTVTDTETTQHSTPKVSRNVEQGIWDRLVDVREPGNATYPVEYNHTDNLFTYHPGEFDLAWEMKGDKALHIHIPKSEIKAAKDNLTLETVIGTALAAGIGAVVTYVCTRWSLFQKIAIFFGVDVAYVELPWALLLIALDAYIFYYNYTKIKWIEDVLETFYGDGWTYIWEVQHLKVYFSWRPEYWPNPWEPTAHSWLFLYRAWNQSFGKYRDTKVFQHSYSFWVDGGGPNLDAVIMPR